MASSRTFYKTEFHVTVLSEEPYGQDGKTLGDVAYDITEGHHNGDVQTLVENETVDAVTAARLLIESGSDPGFFGLTETGDDSSED